MPVVVLYRASGGRVPNAGEHGSYCLKAGGKEYRLMRLSLHPSRAGGQVQDDTLPAVWEADLING